MSLLLLLGLSPTAQAENLQKPPMQMRLKDYQVSMRDYSFPSGLRIIFQEDHTQPIVAITTTVDHGSSSDPVGLNGIAHCAEHMWFRSIHKDAAGKDLPKVWDILKEMGANLNASTADDWTNYMTLASKDNLIPLLRLESLRMHSAVEGVTDEVLRVEREVIRNELRMRYENSWLSSMSSLFVALYPKGHPYFHLGIGTHETLNNITMADVRDFVKKNYGPENTTITVVGDFDLYDTGAMLQNFRIDQLAAPGDSTGASIARVEPKIRVDRSTPAAEPPDPVLAVEVKGEIVNLQRTRGSVEKPMLVLAWSVPGAYRSDDFVFRLAAAYQRYAILQELYPAWEYAGEEPPVAAETFGCFPWDSKHTTKILCALELGEDEDAEKMTERVLNGLYRMTLTDESGRRFQEYFFQRGLVELKSQVFASVDNVAALDGRATSVSAWTHYTGDPRYFSTAFNELAVVNSDEVRSFAERYLRRDRAVAVVVEPYEDGDIDVSGETSAYRGERRDDAAMSVLTEAQAEARVKGALVSPDATKIKVSTLDNGMQVVTMPYSTGPLVQVALRFPTGGGQSPEALRAVRFASEMVRADSYGVVDATRFAGAESMSFDDRTWTLQLTAPAGNLDEAAYVLRSRIDSMIAYTDGKLGWVKAGKKGVLTWMKSPDEWASVVRMQRLLPGSVAADWLSHEDYDALGRLGTRDVAATLAKTLRPENGTLYMVGNITPEEADRAARTWWSGWTAQATAGPVVALDDGYAPPTERAERQVILFDKQDTSQTDVTSSCALQPGDLEHQTRQRVMASVIDDGAWLALREHTGSSYGAGASVDLRGGLAVLNQGVLVQNDQVAAAVQAFHGLVEDMHNGKIDSRLLAIMKLSAAQSYVLGHTSTEQMLGRLMSMPGRSPDRYSWFTRYADVLASVTAADFPPMLEACVGHEVVTLVGPRQVLEPQLAAAGIKTEVFDWKQGTTDYKLAMGLKVEKEKKDRKAAR